MTLAQICLFIFIGTPKERGCLKQKWKSFCEKHLIADMPKELEELDQKLKERGE